MDLGLRMAMAAASAAVADLPRLVGLHFATDSGQRVAAIRPAQPTSAGGPGGEVPGDGTLAWQEYRPGPGGTMQLSGSLAQLAPEAVLARLEQSLAGGGRSEATLIVATRRGATVFEFGRTGVRRLGLPPDRAAEVFADLPDRPRGTPARRAQTVDPADVLSPAAEHGFEPPCPVPAEIRDILDPSRAEILLKAIGMLTPAGRIRRDEARKYNQIVHLISLVADAVAVLPRGRTLTVVDCGCGKSQLLFVLNHVMTEGFGLRAHFVGLDVSDRAVATARDLQAKLGYLNMEFMATPIRTWDPPDKLDAVLSLHACDTATDEAIALGIGAGAPVVIAVPCCQAELARQVGGSGGSGDPLRRALRHGALRRRFGDWMTDALRALYLEASGYGVDVLEYVSPLDTPKNIMLRARRGAAGPRDREAAARSFEAICNQYGLDPSLPRLSKMFAARLRSR